MKLLISGFLSLALVLTLCACSFGGTVSTDPTLDTTTPTGSSSTEETPTTQNQNSVPPSQRSGMLPYCIN